MITTATGHQLTTLEAHERFVIASNPLIAVEADGFYGKHWSRPGLQSEMQDYISELSDEGELSDIDFVVYGPHPNEVVTIEAVQAAELEDYWRSSASGVGPRRWLV